MLLEIVLDVMLHAVGALVFLTFLRNVLQLRRGRVTTARKPLYWFRISNQIMLLLIYGNYLFREVYGEDRGLPRGLTAFGTLLVILLIGGDWWASNNVDETEFDQLLRLQATHELEQFEQESNE